MSSRTSARWLRTPMWFLVIAAIAGSPAVAGSQATGTVPREIRVPLHRVSDRARAHRYRGLTNIFFDSVAPPLQNAARFGEGWSAIEIADIVKGDGLKTIYTVRFRAPARDEVHYVVDTAGTLDFVHGQALTFRRDGDAKVAGVELGIHGLAGAHRRLPYQIIVADGYTYARIAEYRRGRLHANGRDYAVEVVNASRDDPFYGPTTNTMFFVDLNGDGQIEDKASVTGADGPVGAEQVLPRTPFLLGGRAFEVANVDSAGTRLVIRPSSATTAAVVNFKAPDLAAETLGDRRYQLSLQRDSVVLIEFWSTSCGFSEKVRPALNDLVTALRGMPFTWVAVAREQDPEEIQRHLVEHPISGTVTRFDSTAWATYNPMGITPLFVLVGRDGVVRLRAAGATSITAVTKKVNTVVHARVPAPPLP